jgi:hypothetical protein
MISAEFARVTSGHFVASVRSVGSTPSILVHSIENARRFRYDTNRDRCEVELSDGHRIELDFHLFTAAELRGLFSEPFHIEEIRGLDLFHSRFVSDPRWNPPSLAFDSNFYGELEKLEETHSTRPGFIDRANHLLLVANLRRGAPKTTAAAISAAAGHDSDDDGVQCVGSVRAHAGRTFRRA